MTYEEMSYLSDLLEDMMTYANKEYVRFMAGVMVEMEWI